MSTLQHVELIKQLTSCQNRLYGFILTLVPQRDQARDVLQETNLVIWEKADEFTVEMNFWAWAAQIAYYRVLAHYRDRSRDRHVFDEQVLATLHDAAMHCTADDERRDALIQCLEKLSSSQQKLVIARYRKGLAIEEIARQSEQTVGAVKMALMRIRRRLLDCVERTTRSEVST